MLLPTEFPKPDYETEAVCRWHVEDGLVVRHEGRVFFYATTEQNRKVDNPLSLATALLAAREYVAPQADTSSPGDS